jgi:hypothetical protein
MKHEFSPADDETVYCDEPFVCSLDKKNIETFAYNTQLAV